MTKLMPIIKNSGLFLFTKELILHPRSVGAACPSSGHLAKRIAQQVQLPIQGKVLELGAGTGVITAALIKQGLAEEQLLVVERSSALAEHLTKRFANVTVLNEDAQHLSQYLQGEQIDYIVSALPLRSLPKEAVRDILAAAEELLSTHGKFIQFTYSWRANDSLMFKGLKRLYSKYVWFNVPPARIDIYGAND